MFKLIISVFVAYLVLWVPITLHFITKIELGAGIYLVDGVCLVVFATLVTIAYNSLKEIGGFNRPS